MNLWQANQRWETLACALFAAIILVFICFYGTAPIADADFWWHLKTGEVMVESGGLLQSDPFTFSGDGVVSTREALILKGYWLWQITAYGLYALFGFYGIFLLNILTVGAMVGVVADQLRRQQVGYGLAVVLMTLGFSLLRAVYQLERPQMASFLFAAILLGILIRVRDGGQLGWSLPLLMMVWANLHGGFVVGDLILLVFSVGVVIEYRHELPRMRHLLFWIVVSIGASLLNPNGALAFSEILNFQNSELMKGVMEYQSTWTRFQAGSRYVVILWLLIVLYGFGLVSSRRLYWPELLAGLFLAVFSVAYVRNVGFFAIAMLPLIGAHLQQGARRRQWQTPAIISIMLLTLCALFLLWQTYGLWQGRQKAWPVKASYPEAALTFLEKSGLQGRILNSYNQGGYMLWRLYPRYKIFIDGRGLDSNVYNDWLKLSFASATWVNGQMEYEVLLDRYGIDFIMQPIYDTEGMVQPLMKSLLGKSEWVPVYLDGYVYILARQTAKNDKTIIANQMDKSEFKAQLLKIYDYICQDSPRWINPQIARAGMLLYLSRYEEARAQIEAIAAAAPNHQYLPILQRELTFLRQKRF